IGAFSLALALFLIPFLVSTLVGWQRPDVAEMIAGKEALEAASQNFGEELYADMDAKYAGQRSAMAGFYVKNNTGIAFQAYALGAFIGLGTCFILLSNGISIGMVTGYILSAGPPTTENFFSFVISHGSFELTAIVISGGGGFVLAHGILFPGQRTRMDSLRHHGVESLKLALGAGAMLAIAAMLEGYFSPLPISAGIKYLVGSCLWLLVISYLSFAGRGGTASEG
ncbi:MAG: stage II sporulation protein M, partial [Planctomycetota bacterium]